MAHDTESILGNNVMTCAARCKIWSTKVVHLSVHYTNPNTNPNVHKT